MPANSSGTTVSSIETASAQDAQSVPPTCLANTSIAPVNAGNFFGQGLGQDLSRTAPLLPNGGGEIFALRSRDLFQSAERNIQLAREGFGSGSRRTIFVGNLERRSGDLLAEVGLRSRNSSSEHGKPPRGRERLQIWPLRQSFALQEVADTARQFIASGVNHTRGNFFGADFEKEVRHKKRLATSD